MTTRFMGTKHDEQPEYDPLVCIVYADAPRGDDERTGWNLAMAGSVCRTIADGPGAFKGFSGILTELGETPAWEFLAEVAVQNGFDVYDSDLAFEVYRGHTEPRLEPPEPKQEMIAEVREIHDSLGRLIARMEGTRR